MQDTVIAEAPLTFGQLFVWRSMQHIPPRACNLPQIWSLPAGVSAASVEHALEILERRHESLRTRYASGADEVMQTVWAAAAVALEIVDIADDSSVPDTAAVIEELSAAPFDLFVDRPWRARLVARAGIPDYLAICFHHIAVDAWAIGLLQEEFLALLGDRALSDTVPNPRDLANSQWSDASQRQRKSVRRHWQRIFEAAPQMERDPHPEAVSGRWAKVSSPETADAADRIARRVEASVASVMLAAFCLAIVRRTGQEKVLVAVYTNNRSDPLCEKIVATQTQIVPLLFTHIPNEDFDDTARRVHWEVFRSYRHGSYNVDDVIELGSEYGFTGSVNGSFDGSVSGFFSYFFNFLGQYQEVQPARPQKIEVGTGGRNIGAPMYLQVQNDTGLTCNLRENSSAHGYRAVTELLDSIGEVIIGTTRECP